MNKVVVVIVGAIVALVAATAAGVVLLNHLHYSSSSQPNVPYNTLYFINSTPYGFNYLIVLNETTYSQIAQATHNNINVMYSGPVEPSALPDVYLESIIKSGNYVFLVVGTPSLIASNVGSLYNISIPTDHGFYTLQLTYEGNWVGPLP
jgi:hypothetical protein